MIPYILTFLLIALLSFSQFVKGLRKYRVYLFLFIVSYLILFAGLRKVGVGADDLNYYNVFTFYAPTLYEWLFGTYTYDIKEIKMEIGYILVNSFLKTFTDNYTFLFLTIAFLSVGLASYNYFRYSKYVFLTLLLFFVHTYLYRDMNQIRSAVAAAIGLFLIAQIHNRKHFKVFLTLFFAGTFHTASLSLILAYILSFITLTRKKVIIFYIIAVLFGLIGVSQIIINNLPVSGYLAMKLYSYIANERYITAIPSLFDITNIKNSFILFTIILFWKKLEKVMPYFKTIVLFYVIAVFIRIAFYDLGVLAARIATFFGIVEVIIVPYFIYLFRQKLFIMFIIIIYAFLTLYLNLFVKEGRYPYELAIF